MMRWSQAKHKLYLDRLHLIYQRMRRNPMFQQQDQIMTNAGDVRRAQVRRLRRMSVSARRPINQA